MPILGSFGSGSASGFGQRRGGFGPFIVASGGTITVDGDYRVHTFTASGCFEVQSAGFPTCCGGDGSYVDYLVVASGGNGSAGGGGGGGMRSVNRTYCQATGSAGSTPTSGILVSEGTYPIVVGAPAPANGGDSSFGPISSTGGGQGGENPAVSYQAYPGGSGGGGGHRQGSGSGNKGGYSPPEGNPGGGPTGPGIHNIYGSHGGGGMGGAGGAGTTPDGGPGGASGQNSVTGATVEYSGGGSGDRQGGGPLSWQPGTVPATSGAGGSGSESGTNAGVPGRGGGGGSGAPTGPSEGGSGAVIIRYKFQ